MGIRISERHIYSQISTREALIPAEPSEQQNMQAARIIFLLLILGAVFGNPASVDPSMIEDIADKDLRKFYTDFYNDYDIEEPADDKKSTMVDYPDYSEQHNDDKPIHTSAEATEKTSSEIYDSSNDSTSIVSNLKRKDPTFVLSNLLFHLAQLPI